MTKIITHNGQFHTDDIFAVATLFLILGDEAEVVRTRDENLIKSGDYVVDVGNVYDPKINRFDHHQTGGAGIRKNNIPYASFGLVWEKFGEKLCGSKDVSDILDKKIVQFIDGTDNGVDLYRTFFDGIFPYTIYDYLNSFIPTWKEKEKEDKDNVDKNFMKAVEIAGRIIEREIKITKDWIEGEKIIKDIYYKSDEKRIIVIDDYKNFERSQVTDALLVFPEVLYAVFYKKDNDFWQVVALNIHMGTFELRKALPLSWRGKRDEELKVETGVRDAVFCHNNGFMCIAKSKEGAIKLAKLALES